MFSVAFDCKIIHEDHAHWEVSQSVTEISLCPQKFQCWHPTLQAFPQKDCLKMPIIVIAVVGAIMLLISAVISFLQSVAATELDPDSRDILALAHSRF